MAKLSQQELMEFVKRPLIATVVTLNKDGTPHATPAWFDYDGKYAYVVANRAKVKARNAKRDPRVAICVCNDDRPHKYVSIMGKAEVSPERMPEVIRRLAARYMGPEKGLPYAESVVKLGQSEVIKITPTAVFAINMED
ncbi:MAG: PPOX class F420-dependent oxidoreductase [Chloroflexi bacterium]|nr:PPOX class F420-dependent oxidoreductase [Chloroflexota bacterium]